MDLDLKMLNSNILVTELTDDLMVNGVVTIYDQDNPYMIAKVVNRDNLTHTVDVGDIIVIKRYAKEEYLPGQYFVSLQDVRCKMSEDEYNNMIERR
jgi:hypothetical protein